MKKFALAWLFTALMTLTGCDSVIHFLDHLNSVPMAEYAESEQYLIGDAELNANVDTVKIHWFAGDVDVVTTPGKSVLINETSKYDLSDAEKVHYRLNGAELDVQFAESGLEYNKNHHKQLTVSIPEELAELARFEFKAESSELTMKNIHVKDSEFMLDSGDLDVKLPGKTSSVKVVTQSGNIELKVKTAKTVDITTDTGNIELKVRKVVENANLISEEGSISLSMPDDVSFEAKVMAEIGDIQTDFDVKEQDDTFIYDGGKDAKKCVINLATVTGDIDIFQED